MSDVTKILESMDAGDSNAAQELLPLVYDELRAVAAAKMARERPGQTLQATALVHEAWIRLTKNKNQEWSNRRYFFAAAGEAMRRILVENARRKLSQKRGGDHQRVDLDEADISAPQGDDDLIPVHEALDRLAIEDKTKAEIVKLKYFVGLNNDEVAEALNMSEKTVRRHWTFAKTWLYEEIQRKTTDSPDSE